MTTLKSALAGIMARLEQTHVRVIERRDKITGTVDFSFPDYESDLQKLLAAVETLW